jgi:hypothetical protein
VQDGPFLGEGLTWREPACRQCVFRELPQLAPAFEVVDQLALPLGAVGDGSW